MDEKSIFERYTKIALLYSHMYYQQLMDCAIIYNNELNPCIKEDSMMSLFRCSPDLCCKYKETKTFFFLRRLLQEFDITQCFDHYHTSDSVECAFNNRFLKYNTRKVSMGVNLLYDCLNIVPLFNDEAVLVTENVDGKEMLMMAVIRKENFNCIFGEIKHYPNDFLHQMNPEIMDTIDEALEEEDIDDTLPKTLSYNTAQSTITVSIVSEVAPSLKRSSQTTIEEYFLSRKKSKV